MDNKLKTVVVVGVVALLGIGAVLLKNNNNSIDTMPMTDKEDAISQTSQASTKSETKTETTNQVTYKSFAIVQKSIKVKKGTTVTWTNEDSAKHDVTPDKETDEFKASELFGKGETYSHTFSTVGTYAYHCSPHPYMKGTVEVTE